MVEGGLPSKQFKSQHSQAPKVDSHVVLGPLEDFRSHIVKGSTVGLASLVAKGSPAEVAELVDVLGRGKSTFEITTFSGLRSR